MSKSSKVIPGTAPMSAEERAGTGRPAPAGPAQCHFISNTHWDREWRYSMQRTRHMLVTMLDMLLDIFEREPRFQSFHMDSQSIPIQDYLEIRPEKTETVRKHIQDGRLLVGPWYVLPDEFCVGGESLVRNLLLGHRIARELGAVSKTGYSPFSWGQISQMPQIYSGFGIPFAAFYRGINTLVSPNSEFIWEGPDGTRIVGSRLACRPRYNVWYILQRPAFWGLDNEGERLMAWRNGHGPFCFADTLLGELDAQYTHPRFEYHEDTIAERARQTLREQDGEWTTPHRFWSAGHDSSCPDIREVRMIAECDEALGEDANVFHSTFADFQAKVCEGVGDDLPVAHGEMRHFFTKGSSSVLFGWISSAHMEIKQDNAATERALGVVAEPLAVCASLLGAPYPRAFLDHAWQSLLQNHGHDSIGACSRDVVPADMLFRSRQAREISSCVTERALMDIAGAVDLSAHGPDEVAVVAWNPTPVRRSETVELLLNVPAEMPGGDIDLVDENGTAVTVQPIDSVDSAYRIVQSPNDCANMFEVRRQRILAELPELPGTGYRTFFVTPREEPRRGVKHSLLTGPQSMANEFLAVTVNGNGTFSVEDRKTGRSWDGLGYFRDCSEIGNPWEHITVPEDEVLTTLNERARVALVRDGELATSFRVELNWELPKRRSENEKHRSTETVPCRIVNTVTLRRHQPWVEIVTELDNTAEDHYLQVSFPTGVTADTVQAQTPFDVVTRPIERVDPSLFAEKPQTEHPMDRFVDVSDGDAGVALLNEGLKAYEAHDDPAQTLSLTLLRCFPLRICITNLEMTDYSKQDKGSQCPGPHRFRYAFIPHSGDWQQAGLWQQAERFANPPRVAQIGPTRHGHLPLTRSFLELEPQALHVSAVKQSEDGQGWVVRLLNPTDAAIAGRIRLNGGCAEPDGSKSPVERQQAEFALPANEGRAWTQVRRVTLEEVPEETLDMDAAGWTAIKLSPKKILTLEFSSN